MFPVGQNDMNLYDFNHAMFKLARRILCPSVNVANTVDTDGSSYVDCSQLFQVDLRCLD